MAPRGSQLRSWQWFGVEHLKHKRKPSKTGSPKADPAVERETADLRIIGGSMRGRKLLYSGDERTRPMKDRVREAVFNLVGPAVKGAHAIDLFAGTGALGLEAISRGAERATLLEQHFPTAAIIRQNAQQLEVLERCEICPANTFIWSQQQAAWPTVPWVVFCSPPYAFYVDREADMVALVERLLDRAPTGSVFVVEFDSNFDPALLPRAGEWDIREYPPAVVAVLHIS